MCGISGFYSETGVFTEQELLLMNDSLLHRGPENGGFHFDGFLGLAHRRLKIIDLSDNANQPMFSDDMSKTLVFNGEIYNYDSIRREQAWSVKTTSDTEILLKALQKWGTEVFEQLNGMFAFAYYDFASRELLLARDRMGIKPLYYFYDGQNLAFASELKALLMSPFIKSKASINKVAVNQFLHLGYIPEPLSIYENIFKLPVGSYLLFKNGVVTIKKYWDCTAIIEPEPISDYVQAKEILRDLITDSVRLRMRADVPFGTFLSGGIDSSLVTAVAQRNSSSAVKTFSIGFENNQFNESKYAKKVADYLKTDHHEFLVTENDAKMLIPELLSSFDEPYADSSAIPTMLVSRLAKQHVTMTLSGDGGDELFMGYGAHLWADRLGKPTVKNFRHIAAFMFSMLNNRYKRIGELLDYKNTDFLPSHIFSQEQYLFSRTQISGLLNKDYYHSFDLGFKKESAQRNLTAMESQALFDLLYYLPGDLLTKVDRASMKYALEVRVPLLDYNIVSFALNLAPELKVKNGVQKFLLKEVLYDFIPAQLFNRPKWGFSIPLCSWLKKDLSYLITDYLSSAVIEKHGVVNYQTVQLLKKRFATGKCDYLYNRLWLLIVLHIFLENR
ncbi:MAG: asparagine synthase (glutamine-hydrolyzing) [Bacteroidales bacterium]|nr:asparagine synthase (glutamine-hydrolyzing) [Bacteroidales bacterium]